jgi:site-specific recombinase XerD
MTLTVAATIEWFLQDCRARNLSPKTLIFYRERLKPLVEEYGQRSPASVAPAELKHWVQALRDAKGWSVSTTNHTIISLKVYYKFLIEEEVVTDNPTTKLKKLKTDAVLPEPFTDDEITRMLATCPASFLGARDKAMLLVLLDCGLRLAELLDLTTSTVRLDTGTITVTRGKGGKGRVVPYSPPVRRALMRYLAYREATKPDSDDLWVTEYGHPLGREAVKTITRRWERQSGVPDIHLHRFRHSFAASYLQGGGSPAHLQHLLGHSTPEMTQRYGHLVNLDSTDDHRKASPATRLLGHRWRG